MMLAVIFGVWGKKVSGDTPGLLLLCAVKTKPRQLQITTAAKPKK